MPFLHGLPRLVCALAGLALAGCYSPYRYAPYSPYGQGVPTYNPQVAPAPQFGPPVGSPTPLAPNGGVPGGSFPPADGSFAPSNNGSGSQFNDGSQLTPTPDPNSSFPPSGSGSGSDGFNPRLPSDSAGGLVPNYGDPDTLPSSPRSGNTFEGNSTPFQQDGASFQRESDASPSVGQRPYEPASPGGRVQLAAHQSAPPEAISVGNNPAPTSANAANPYGYDAEGYRWLRGIVDFDEQQNVWVLIYDLTPDSSDAYKGQITLVDSPLLGQLRNNDVVFVEGHVDATTRDQSTGKPQYRVETLHSPLAFRRSETVWGRPHFAT